MFLKKSMFPIPMSASISTSYDFSTRFASMLMIPNEHHEGGGGDKSIDILFGDMMGQDILKPTIQEERKRTSILPGGINVWAAFCPAGERPRLI